MLICSSGLATTVARSPPCALSLPPPTSLCSHIFLQQVQQSYEYFDADRSNSLNFDEIHNALTHAGAPRHA